MPSVESLKKLIRSVLVSSKEGVPIGRFQSDYKDLTQSGLKPEKYGFETVADLLRSMPDVVRISYSGGEAILRAVHNEQTAHIQQLVARQKPKKIKRSKRSFKCIKPWVGKSQKFVSQSVASRYHNPWHFNNWKSKIRPKSEHIPKTRTISWSRNTTQTSKSHNDGYASKAKLSPLNVEIFRNSGQKTVSRNEDSCTKMNPIIVNRIKSVLGCNPGGIFSHNFQGLYAKLHGTKLPESVLKHLLSKGLAEVVRVEQHFSGSQIRYIMYPVDQQTQKTSKNMVKQREEGRKFDIDTDKNEISIDSTMKNRILTLLQSQESGIAMSDFPMLYRQQYGHEISDSIIHGIECGQIKGIARIEKQSHGNREYVTFHPYLEHASGVTKLVNVNAVHKLVYLPVEVKRRIEHIIESNAIDVKLTGLVKIYSESYKEDLKPEVIDYIKCGRLDNIDLHENKNGELILSRKRQHVKPARIPKYPAVMKNLAAIAPKELCLSPSTPFSGKITHILKTGYFYVQILLDQDSSKNVCDIPVEKGNITSKLEPGSIVMAGGKRAKVTSVSDGHTKVFFMDYGYTCNLTKSDIHPLPGHLTEIPQLAVLCLLEGVCSSNQDASKKVLEPLINSEVFVEVMSTKYECINDIDSETRVHIVQCYQNGHDIKSKTARHPCKSQQRQIDDVSNTSNFVETSSISNAAKKALLFSENDSSDTSSSPTRSSGSEFETNSSLVDTDSYTSSSEDGYDSPPKSLPPKGVCISESESSSYVPSFSSSISGLKEDSNEVKISIEALDETDGRSAALESTLETLHDLEDWRKSNSITNSEKVAYFSLQCFSHHGTFGKFLSVEITRILGPNEFYMVPIERFSYLMDLTIKMTQYFLVKKNCTPCSPLAKSNTIYATICQIDSLPVWRRVVVRQIHQDIASVYLVDRGQVDVVPVKSLYRLPGSLAVLPYLAMAGRLGGIVMKNPTTSETLQRFEELVLGQAITAHVVDCSVVKNSIVFETCLFRENSEKCINDLMVDDWNVAEYISVF